MVITYTEFDKVDLRSGTIVMASEFPRAKKPAFKVWADFGAELGVLQTMFRRNFYANAYLGYTNRHC